MVTRSIVTVDLIVPFSPKDCPLVSEVGYVSPVSEKEDVAAYAGAGITKTSIPNRSRASIRHMAFCFLLTILNRIPGTQK